MKRTDFMKTRQAGALVLCASLALGAVAAGCGAAPDEPETSASAATKGPLAVQPHGPARLITQALSEVPLSPEQRAQIERLAAEADARFTDTGAARKALSEAVAAQVESGKIDRAALKPKIDMLGDALLRQQPADRAALERLHAILDPAQREALVAAIENSFHDRKHDRPGRHRMEEWAKDLKLTAEQRDQIRSAMKAKLGERDGKSKWREGAHRAKRVLEAFTEDRFVLDEIAPASDLRARSTEMADRIIGLVEAALPVLTPEQRALAAAKIRSRGSEMPEMAP
jgi:Spy/CpxP family protein refolding chaperone